MAELTMAFILTKPYDSPKPSRLFWMCHLLGWGSLSLVDSLLSIITGASFYLGAFAFALIMLIETAVCLRLRSLIYGKQLLKLPLTKVWGKLALYSVGLSFIAAANIRIFVNIFVFFWPQAELIEIQKAIGLEQGHFFMPLILNWISLSIMMLFWGFIYVAVKYSNQLGDAKRASAELALELRNAQLNTLMAQLNPHFLFNSLNNIRGLMLEDVSKSRDMITRLAEMLRYSLLSDKQEFETLDNELGVVRAYLKLCSIQYEERLHYVEDIDTSLLNCDIPPMLIQMLIENAVKYGIDQTATGGEIKLVILELDEKMIIHVSNPGSLQNDKIESTGLGVKNIQKRLNLLYADAANFSIRQDENHVIATVSLPTHSPIIENYAASDSEAAPDLLDNEPSAVLNEEPSAVLNQEPSAVPNKEPSAAPNKEPSAVPNKESLPQ